MTHPYARSTSGQLHPRLTPRAHPTSAHPCPHSSSLADALGLDGPPKLYKRPAQQKSTAPTNVAHQRALGGSGGHHGDSNGPPMGEQRHVGQGRSRAQRRLMKEAHPASGSRDGRALPPALHPSSSSARPPSAPASQPSTCVAGPTSALTPFPFSNFPYDTPIYSHPAYHYTGAAASVYHPKPETYADADPYWNGIVRGHLGSTALPYEGDATAVHPPNTVIPDARAHRVPKSTTQGCRGLTAQPARKAGCAPSSSSAISSISSPAIAPTLVVLHEASLGHPQHTFEPPTLEEQRLELGFWGGITYAPLLRAPDADKCFRIVVPPDTDAFSVPIIVWGSLGLQCSRCVNIRRSVENRYIFKNVEGAYINIDYAFKGADIFVHRGLFDCDSRTMCVFNSSSHKKPRARFTFGRLLTMMVEKQYKCWHTSAFKGSYSGKDLQDLVGEDLMPNSGTMVTWDNIYLVAIRRLTDRYHAYHYFPEVEIRL